MMVKSLKISLIGFVFSCVSVAADLPTQKMVEEHLLKAQGEGIIFALNLDANGFPIYRLMEVDYTKWYTRETQSILKNDRLWIEENFPEELDRKKEFESERKKKVLDARNRYNEKFTQNDSFDFCRKEEKPFFNLEGTNLHCYTLDGDSFRTKWKKCCPEEDFSFLKLGEPLQVSMKNFVDSMEFIADIGSDGFYLFEPSKDVKENYRKWLHGLFCELVKRKAGYELISMVLCMEKELGIPLRFSIDQSEFFRQSAGGSYCPSTHTLKVYRSQDENLNLHTLYHECIHLVTSFLGLNFEMYPSFLRWRKKDFFQELLGAFSEENNLLSFKISLEGLSFFAGNIRIENSSKEKGTFLSLSAQELLDSCRFRVCWKNLEEMWCILGFGFFYEEASDTYSMIRSRISEPYFVTSPRGFHSEHWQESFYEMENWNFGSYVTKNFIRQFYKNFSNTYQDFSKNPSFITKEGWKEIFHLHEMDVREPFCGNLQDLINGKISTEDMLLPQNNHL